MKRLRNRWQLSICVMLSAVAMLAIGCAGASRPSKFYLLRPLTESESGVAKAPESGTISVLIGPVTLPAYLDRAQMVTVAGEHELVLYEFTRWAEPLQDNVYRVLAENLSLLLNTPRVFTYDRRGNMAADFQVIIDVTRFDSVTEGDAYLNAFWEVLVKNNHSHSIIRKSVFHARPSAKSITGILEAQNLVLTEFSRELAEAVRSLQR